MLSPTSTRKLKSKTIKFQFANRNNNTAKVNNETTEIENKKLKSEKYSTGIRPLKDWKHVAEIRKLQDRKHAATSALKFFKDIVPVKNANIVNPFASITTLDDKNYQRTTNCSVIQLFENAARTRVGNCSEKVAICYAALLRNPIIIRHSYVTICHSHAFNYEFIMIYDKNPTLNHRQLSVKDFDYTAMIVDPWSNDWYFPNLDTMRAFTNNLVNIANIFQARSRFQVTHFPFYLLSRSIFPWNPIEDIPFEIPIY